MFLGMQMFSHHLKNHHNSLTHSRRSKNGAHYWKLVVEDDARTHWTATVFELIRELGKVVYALWIKITFHFYTILQKPAIWLVSSEKAFDTTEFPSHKKLWEKQQKAESKLLTFEEKTNKQKPQHFECFCKPFPEDIKMHWNSS